MKFLSAYVNKTDYSGLLPSFITLRHKVLHISIVIVSAFFDLYK